MATLFLGLFILLAFLAVVFLVACAGLSLNVQEGYRHGNVDEVYREVSNADSNV